MTDTDLYKEILGIAIVFALLGTAVWAMGRRHQGSPVFWGRLQRSGGRMRVIERLHLTPQHTLVLLEIGHRTLLVSVYPGGCALLEPGLPAAADFKEPRKMNPRFAILATAVLPLAAAPATRAPILGPLIPSQTAAGLSWPMQIILLLTMLTVLPAAVMSITPFLRITVVLHFLRQALGTQTTPSNQVLIGLALFLTILIVSPLAADIYTQAWEPMETGQLSPAQAFDAGAKPLKVFLLRFAREKDLRLFLEITRTAPPASPAELDLRVVIPAYVISELKTGFQIGAVLFLPFLVIDLVIASVTLSVGMVQLPPVMVSAPLKILLFVLVDGWNLVIGSLVRSFY